MHIQALQHFKVECFVLEHIIVKLLGRGNLIPDKFTSKFQEGH